MTALTEAQRLIRREAAKALEDSLYVQLRQRQCPEPEREYRFDQQRRWRFDFAWPDLKLAVEVEGATFAQGRHTRGSGYRRDTEKYNAAALAGWKVLRFDGGLVKDETAADALALIVMTSVNGGRMEDA